MVYYPKGCLTLPHYFLSSQKVTQSSRLDSEN